MNCIICGAPVPEHRSPAHTCDSLCRRARDASRTREQQTLFEMREADEEVKQEMRRPFKAVFLGDGAYYFDSPYKNDSYQS